MALENLGYTIAFENFRIENNLQDFEVGRVILEHKDRFIVSTLKGEIEAEITGNMRFTATGREDFPAVGDWVALMVYDADFAIIQKIFPRKSILQRQAVGHHGDVQIIATNVDVAFLVQAVDRDFNINRLERYLTICHSSGIQPVIILTKTDLANKAEVAEILENIAKRIKEVQVLAVSNETQDGYDALKGLIEKGKTYCMLGSSGVGKSTLLNNLSGKQMMKTDAISVSNNKGRHVTTHRELTVLENGGILIDNPGMREVGIADTSTGLETTFDEILAIGKNCRYDDCTHTGEKGCAVAEAVEQLVIDKNSYENYLKMEREKARFETNVAEKRRHEKIFGKILKDFKKKDFKQKGY